MWAGNDGGFYWTTNGAGVWDKSPDLPITQFYAGTIDPSNPSRLLGGTQDNGTLLTSGSPLGWFTILGGDGFQCLVDPTNPSIVFSEWQNCCDHQGLLRSTSGGPSGTFPTGITFGDRFNWMTPVVMDPGNHNVLLLGSQRVYKSTNNGVGYSIVSGDLTTNPVSSLVFGTISTLAISPASSSVYYAGTDDGRVWRSLNAGGTWTEISAGLPVRWVTRVTPDPASAAVVYVTLSGFGQDEHLPHVYRSADQGATWTSISGNLPDVPVNDLIVDPADPSSLFIGTDVGVFFTRNLGGLWTLLGSGMPIQTVFDLSFHPGSRTLVAATHGRSQWKLDLSTWPTAVAPPAVAPRLALGPPVPNPSRGPVSLGLDAGGASSVDVAIYDASGRLLRGLHSGPAGGARITLAWDGLDARGRRAPPGVYFVRASALGAAKVQRLVRTE